MDIILISKILLGYVIPATIIFGYCLWKHFQESDELAISDLFVYLTPSLIPVFNIGVVMGALFISITMIAYKKLGEFVIYKKK